MSQIPDNKIIIVIKDGKTALNTSKPIHFDDLLTILLNLCLQQMKKVVATCPAEHKQAAKGSLYDMFNVMCSKILKVFAPEFELRPGLTALAIKEAEDRIIKEGRFEEFEQYT